MKLLILTVLSFLSIVHVENYSFGQRSGPVDIMEEIAIKGDVIVRLHKGSDPKMVLDKMPNEFDLKINRCLSKHTDIWLFNYDQTASIHEVIENLYRIEEVWLAQTNTLVELRQAPNDPLYGNQWQHQNINSEEAWDITTGGTAASGEDIVVCIIESANVMGHPDLVANHWTNTAETLDGTDTDGNGYIDDVNGWNVSTNNHNIGTGGHGTSVAGMIGAKGDNGVGVVGANWDVKMMVVAGYDNPFTQANIVEAYTYPLDARLLWNATAGAEGAFVVATNASWGIDGADPADYPIWCGFYQDLGEAGILNCGATSNSNVNVDVVGDMPTGCLNDYMVAVTATNNADVKTFAGYGVNSINVAAPGDNIYTTNNGGYGNTSGTSFASPYTAGVIGLMYSIPCPSFMDFVKADPQGAADMVRNALYDGVDQTTQLLGMVTSGGRINAKNSIDLLMSIVCSGTICLAPSAISVNVVANDEANINFTPYASADATNLYWREVGAATWNMQAAVSSPVNLSGLTECTEYEFYFQSDCAGDMSNPSGTQSFFTTGCGNCVELPYCTNAATDGVDEWIESFTIDTYTNVSGNDQGYGDFTMNGSIDLDIDATYNFTVDVAWSGTLYDEYTRIWLDLNQNGTFEAGEMLFDQGAATQTNVNGTITIPSTALLGSTRMRVQMAYLGTGQTTLPGVCGTFTWGEVEDYCVNLTQAVICGMTVNSTVTTPTCEGQENGSIAVAVSGGVPGYSYNWGTAGGNVDNISSLSDGLYMLTITDDSGCDTTISYNLAYNITLGANFNNSDVSCNGAADGESVVTGTGGTGYDYQWTAGPAAATYSGLNGGNYSVTITDIASGCETLESTTIIEPAIDQVGFTSNVNFLNVNFTNTSSMGSYVWDFGDGVGTSSLTSPSYSYAAAGTYTVCLELTTACGVLDVCNDVTVTENTTGLAALNSESVVVYPNPSNGVVNFKVTSANVASIEILDVVGKVITTRRVVSELTTFDLSELYNGTYFYRVKDANDSVLAVDKVMIAR